MTVLLRTSPEREGDSSTREFTIYEIHDNGRKSIAYQQKKEVTESSKTQLDALVDHITDFAKKRNIKKLQPICLPSLAG